MATISYQVEPFSQCLDEMRPLWPAHWEEIARDKDTIKLDVNEAMYRKHEALGMLHLVTVRADGRLIGYIWGIVQPHLHYQSTLHCFTDVFYVDPAFRKGGVGIKLFQEYERTLAQRGVKKCYIASKVYHDLSKLFERLGWNRTETVYTKVLG